MTALLAVALLTPATYTHKISHEGSRLTVLNSETGEVVWWRTTSHPNVSWTPDRRTMVSLGYEDELLYWRAGHRVKRIPYDSGENSILEPPGPTGSPTISADGRYAAVFMGSTQGSILIEAYEAFVVDLEQGDAVRLRMPGKEDEYLTVRSMKWIDRSSLAINEMKWNGQQFEFSDQKWIRRRNVWERST